MQDYWQAELVPAVWLEGPEILEFVLDHVRGVEAVPDSPG